MKKILLAATAVALFASMAPSVQAQNPPGGTGAPATPQSAPNFPAKGTPGAASSSATAPMPRKHAKRVSLQQHFDAANTTHDGHLTRAQAAAANWTYVTKHFDVMDSTHKGYVTVADVHAYGVAAHAARAQRKAATPAAASAPATSAPVTAAPAPLPSTTAPPATTK